jgi:parallel beta-helix repeat protein
MTGGSHLRWRELRVRRGLPSITVSLLLISALFVGLDLSFDIIPNVSSGLIEVDDSGGKDYQTIQEGVDAAQPGDTVLVYAGTYDEDVVIDKTINLTGEDRDTTIINSTDKMGIYVTNADFVNISGFTVVNGSWAGIRLMPSNNSIIENTKIEDNNYGVEIVESSHTTFRNNLVLSSFAVGIEVYKSSNNYLYNNTSSNDGHGIRLYSGSNNNIVSGNQVISNLRGIYIIVGSDENIVKDNIINGNSQYGIAISNSNQNILENNTLLNNQVGIRLSSTNGTNLFINSSINSSISYDVEAGPISNDLFLNTTFNTTKTYFYDTSSTIEIQWYLHIDVIDYLGNPVPDSQLKIEDNKNGSYQKIFTTDGGGFKRWLIVTEYLELDSDGNTIGEKIYYTPHLIIAKNDTLVGYAQPFINKSKFITITLHNGTLLGLEPGWNLISFPRVQSNTNLGTVLQSIERKYSAIQWYNLTDSNDHWKHYHISKPPNLNDLKKINHTKGFWIYINDPGGTTLVVFGEVLTAIQNITLYPGWNLVGYPSNSNKTRDLALANILFDSDVDSIWTHNATTKTWDELNVG